MAKKSEIIVRDISIKTITINGVDYICHINNIYKVEELDRKSTCAKIAQVQIEGKRSVKRNEEKINFLPKNRTRNEWPPLPSALG